MLQWARRRKNVLPASVGSLGILLSYLLLGHSLPAFIFIILATIFFVYLEVVTQWSFRAPTRRKPEIEDSNWERMALNINGLTLVHYLQRGRKDAPLAWVIHGWTSGSMRMLQRAESFLERGWNVLMVDLPDHGGSGGLAKWSAEETTTHLIAGMNEFQRANPNLCEHGVWYYGHSMGSFIGLRLSHRRTELSIADKFQGWIFESPMTGYTEIHEETCNILRIPRILRPWVLAKTIRHFNAINGPQRNIKALADADVPAWGMTSEPTLLVQAEPDERLGPTHHQRLVLAMREPPYDGLLQAHYLSDLRHSGSHDSQSRKAVVDEWLEEQISQASSV